MAETQRNIVLITVDSLRADHCGFTGVDVDTTPTLDRWAEEGIVFERAVAPAPFTVQSMPPTFTGEYPIGGRGSFGEERDRIAAHVDARTMPAERLAERGYATAGFSPNPYASRHFGFDRGFDEYMDFIGEESWGKTARTMLSRLRAGDFVEAMRLGANMASLSIPGFGNQSIPARAYHDLVMEWVETAEDPFFLWLFLLDVHSPYRPVKQFREMSFLRMLRLNLIRSSLVNRDPTPAETEALQTLYAGSVRSVDAYLGGLREALDAYDPVFVVTSDHGEAFGEHGDFGHNELLYEENVAVPLVIAGLDDHDRIAAPISLRRLPRILEALASGTSVDWKSFTDESVTARAIEEDGHPTLAARGRDWKYIATPNRTELYDLEADPGERSPLEDDPRGAHARERLARHVDHATERRIIHDGADELAGGELAL